MFSIEAQILLLEQRRRLLNERDASVNANIIAKITRRIRKLSKDC